MNFILGFICVIIFTALSSFIYVYESEKNKDNEVH